MSRGHLSWWSMILGRNCPGAVIWGQFFLVGILRRAIVQGELSCSLWRGWDEWRASVGGMLLLMLLLLLKCYPEEENNECQLLKKKMKKKNVPNRFGQWFKRRTWLEEQVLVYTVWAGNAGILNMPESWTWLNLPKYTRICLKWSNVVNVAEYPWSITYLNKLEI